MNLSGQINCVKIRWFGQGGLAGSMQSHRRKVNCVEIMGLQQRHVQQTLFNKGCGEVGEEKWKLRAWKSWVRKGIWGFYLLFRYF